MAIDYGTKRTGVAVSDSMQLIACGLATAPSAEAVAFICDYAAKEPLDAVVVGLPKQLNNEASDSQASVRAFVKRLQKAAPQLAVEYYDERFTSTIAHRLMIDGGLKRKKRQDKALVDEISATLILQDYLEQKRNNKL